MLLHRIPCQSGSFGDGRELRDLRVEAHIIPQLALFLGQLFRRGDARTREECEEKLKVLIAEMNEERKNLKEQLAGIAPPEKLTKKQRKLWDYMRLHPEVTEFSTLAKRTGLARNTVKKHYEMVAAMLGEMSE